MLIHSRVLSMTCQAKAALRRKLKPTVAAAAKKASERTKKKKQTGAAAARPRPTKRSHAVVTSPAPAAAKDPHSRAAGATSKPAATKVARPIAPAIRAAAAASAKRARRTTTPTSRAPDQVPSAPKVSTDNATTKETIPAKKDTGAAATSDVPVAALRRLARQKKVPLTAIGLNQEFMRLHRKDFATMSFSEVRQRRSCSCTTVVAVLTLHLCVVAPQVVERARGWDIPTCNATPKPRN